MERCPLFVKSFTICMARVGQNQPENSHKVGFINRNLTRRRNFFATQQKHALESEAKDYRFAACADCCRLRCGAIDQHGRERCLG